MGETQIPYKLKKRAHLEVRLNTDENQTKFTSRQHTAERT